MWVGFSKIFGHKWAVLHRQHPHFSLNFDRACLILHNLCIRAGDDGVWLEEEAGPQRVQQLMLDQQAAAGADGGPAQQEPEELRLMLPAAQRRAGEARRRELVGIFRA